MWFYRPEGGGDFYRSIIGRALPGRRRFFLCLPPIPRNIWGASVFDFPDICDRRVKTPRSRPSFLFLFVSEIFFYYPAKPANVSPKSTKKRRKSAKKNKEAQKSAQKHGKAQKMQKSAEKARKWHRKSNKNEETAREKSQKIRKNARRKVPKKRTKARNQDQISQNSSELRPRQTGPGQITPNQSASH